MVSKSNPTKDQIYSDEEISRRSDELLKRMINTPPQTHKPLGKPKPKAGGSPKKRGRPTMIKGYGHLDFTIGHGEVVLYINPTEQGEKALLADRSRIHAKFSAPQPQSLTDCQRD
jgi:hypothetical protein